MNEIKTKRKQKSQLTLAEEATSNALLQVLAGFEQMQLEAINSGWEKYNGDNAELCYHVHALQNWVLANIASRSMPEQYRPFGARHKDNQSSGEDAKHA